MALQADIALREINTDTPISAPHASTARETRIAIRDIPAATGKRAAPEDERAARERLAKLRPGRDYDPASLRPVVEPGGVFVDRGDSLALTLDPVSRWIVMVGSKGVRCVPLSIVTFIEPLTPVETKGPVAMKLETITLRAKVRSVGRRREHAHALPIPGDETTLTLDRVAGVVWVVGPSGQIGIPLENVASFTPADATELQASPPIKPQRSAGRSVQTGTA